MCVQNQLNVFINKIQLLDAFYYSKIKIDSASTLISKTRNYFAVSTGFGAAFAASIWRLIFTSSESEATPLGRILP